MSVLQVVTANITNLSDGTNTTSTTNAVRGSAKAWVNFSGSTATVNASYNVSSITKNATGNYTINFSSALSSANQSIAGYADVNGSKLAIYGGATGTLSTSTLNINVATSGGVTALSDGTVVSVVVFV